MRLLTAFLRAGGLRAVLLSLGLLCSAAVASQALNAGVRYTGRVVYRDGRTAAAGVQVDLVEAEDDGRPTDDILGTARADAGGRFSVVPEKSVPANVALVASAVRASAESGGDRRGEGYEIRTERIRLGFLPHPSSVKPNTIFIERRKPGRSPAEDR